MWGRCKLQHKVVTIAYFTIGIFRFCPLRCKIPPGSYNWKALLLFGYQKPVDNKLCEHGTICQGIPSHQSSDLGVLLMTLKHVLTADIVGGDPYRMLCLACFHISINKDISLSIGMCFMRPLT